MTNCPCCGRGSAEIGFLKVYCINSDCQWFDEDQLEKHLAECRKYTNDATIGYASGEFSLPDDVIASFFYNKP